MWGARTLKSQSYVTTYVNQAVHIGVKHPSGDKTKFLLLSESCGFVDVGRPLWREDGSVVYNCCWPSPAQSFSGPYPEGLMTIFRARTLQSQSYFNWLFTTNQFILASSPLRFKTTDFFLLNSWSHSPYVISSLARESVCLLRMGFAFLKCNYHTYKVLLEILPFALYTSPSSV
jgi:hypothetical protein